MRNVFQIEHQISDTANNQLIKRKTLHLLSIRKKKQTKITVILRSSQSLNSTTTSCQFNFSFFASYNVKSCFKQSIHSIIRNRQETLNICDTRGHASCALYFLSSFRAKKSPDDVKNCRQGSGQSNRIKKSQKVSLSGLTMQGIKTFSVYMQIIISLFKRLILEVLETYSFARAECKLDEQICT